MDNNELNMDLIDENSRMRKYVLKLKSDIRDLEAEIFDMSIIISSLKKDRISYEFTNNKLIKELDNMKDTMTKVF